MIIYITHLKIRVKIKTPFMIFFNHYVDAVDKADLASWIFLLLDYWRHRSKKLSTCRKVAHNVQQNFPYSIIINT